MAIVSFSFPQIPALEPQALTNNQVRLGSLEQVIGPRGHPDLQVPSPSLLLSPRAEPCRCPRIRTHRHLMAILWGRGWGGKATGSPGNGREGAPGRAEEGGGEGEGPTRDRTGEGGPSLALTLCIVKCCWSLSGGRLSPTNCSSRAT